MLRGGRAPVKATTSQGLEYSAIRRNQPRHPFCDAEGGATALGRQWTGGSASGARTDQVGDGVAVVPCNVVVLEPVCRPPASAHTRAPRQPRLACPTASRRSSDRTNGLKVLVRRGGPRRLGPPATAVVRRRRRRRPKGQTTPARVSRKDPSSSGRVIRRTARPPHGRRRRASPPPPPRPPPSRGTRCVRNARRHAIKHGFQADSRAGGRVRSAPTSRVVQQRRPPTHVRSSPALLPTTTASPTNVPAVDRAPDLGRILPKISLEKALILRIPQRCFLCRPPYPRVKRRRGAAGRASARFRARSMKERTPVRRRTPFFCVLNACVISRYSGVRVRDVARQQRGSGRCG